jgi:hypothetical protein
MKQDSPERSATLPIAIDIHSRSVVLPSGQAVMLGRHGPLWNIVVALTNAHARDELSVQDLAEAGWPGERMSRPAARNRVHVALSTLRALGFADVLVRGGVGYAFAPRLGVDAA